MKEEKLNGILKIIEGMPKYEWDRIHMKLAKLTAIRPSR